MGIRKVVHGSVDPSGAIDDLYSLGRQFPHGRGPDVRSRGKDGAYQSHSLPTHDEQPDPEQQKPEDPIDQHGAGYSNNSKGWVRGHGSPHPYFDRSKHHDK